MRGTASILRLSGPVAVMSCLCFLPACRPPKEGAKSELEAADYAWTQTDWFRATRENQVAVMKRFVDGGFDVQTKDADGRVALHEAARAGAVDAAEFLLEKGRVVDVRGANGRTPLMEAALADQAGMIRWLLRQGADPMTKDDGGYPALMLAVREGRRSAVDELAAVQKDGLESALLLAALTGRAEVMDSLTNYGASVYARMEDGRTPLMIAAENGHEEAVKFLLEMGANRHATDDNGSSATDHAAANGYQAIVALLLDETGKDTLSLDTPMTLGADMSAVMAEPMEGQSDSAQETEATTGRMAVVPLDGIVLGDSTTVPPPSAAETSRGASAPGLVMRSYRERELPIRVITVHDGKAEIEIRGATTRLVVVAPGQTIPGSRLVVVKADRRMRDSKLQLGETVEVSLVEVRDPETGHTREWISGHPATAHDPVALVEDAVTGQRYLASPGQKFRAPDGSEFLVSDVRPTQLVIESVASGEVTTLPLRGPRG